MQPYFPLFCLQSYLNEGRNECGVVKFRTVATDMLKVYPAVEIRTIL